MAQNHDLADGSGAPRAAEYLRVLLARRWLVLGVFAVIVAGAALVTFTQTPRFKASGRILIEPRKPKAVALGEVYEAGDSNREYYETQYRLLQDRQLAARVFQETGFGDRPLAAGLGRPLEAFLDAIRVEPIVHSRLVDVGFIDPDPAWSARVANALVAAYIEENQKREVGTAQRVLKELAVQAQELQPKFQASSAALQTFKEQSDIVTLDESAGNIILDRLARLNAAVTESEIQRVSAQAQYEAAERVRDAGGDLGSLPAVAQDETLQKLTLELAAAEQERARLASRYLPKHPAVMAVEGRIAVLGARIAAERGRILQGLRVRYDEAAAGHQRLQTALAEQKHEGLRLSRLAMQYRLLKDEADRVGRLYDVVLERMKEIDLVSEMAREGTNVFVIHEAFVPDRPVSPRKHLNVALAALAGLALGIGLAFFVEHLDTSLKGQEDVEKVLGLPILGFVPAIKAARQAAGAPGPAGRDLCRELVGLHHGRSASAEAFRTIRTGIAFSAAGRKMKRLLVTSPCPREGKTLVSINTAAALARAGARVLLVDADMRRPSVHRAFGLRPTAGLASYLVAENGDMPLDRAIQKSGLPNLDLLLCDRRPPNPAELLGSPRMKALLREAAKRYDRIILDSPPTAAVADAGVLSSLADGVLLVVRAFNTDRHLAQRSRETIEGVRGRLIGVVINDVDATKHGKYYGYRGYYRRYGGDGADLGEAGPEDGGNGDGAGGAGPPGPADEAALAGRRSQELTLLRQGERR
jgi:capsular exopolysaccharide synthesis family protein